MRQDEYLVRLEAERNRAAHAAVATPTPDLFGYGRAVGFYAGLAKAKLIYEETLADDDERRRNI